MTPALQAKLLRVLQEGTIIPVGASQERKVRVRVLAATHRNLPEMIDQGKFREDLYYRLNVVGIDLPPLRDRPGDIPLLVEHFLERAAKRSGGERRRFSPEALTALEGYTWRGNIRELENEIERALIIAGDEQTLGLDVLSERLTKPGQYPAGSFASSAPKTELRPAAPPAGANLKEIIERVEREEIEKALVRLRWNRSKAAKTLGISRSNLLAKIDSYGLKPPPELQPEAEE